MQSFIFQHISLNGEQFISAIASIIGYANHNRIFIAFCVVKVAYTAIHFLIYAKKKQIYNTHLSD